LLGSIPTTPFEMTCKLQINYEIKNRQWTACINNTTKLVLKTNTMHIGLANKVLLNVEKQTKFYLSYLPNNTITFKVKINITLYIDGACRQNPTLPIPPKKFFINQWKRL
jgi:hypothetical protein